MALEMFNELENFKGGVCFVDRIDGEKQGKEVKDISAVKVFPDVFPEELLDYLQKRNRFYN